MSATVRFIGGVWDGETKEMNDLRPVWRVPVPSEQKMCLGHSGVVIDERLKVHDYEFLTVSTSSRNKYHLYLFSGESLF